MKYSYRMSKSSQGILKPVEINKYMMKWKLNSAHNDQIYKFLKFRNVANNKWNLPYQILKTSVCGF